MINEKAIQKAGDNSQQYQANTINIIQGIDEKRAREICSEMQKKAMEVYTAESQLISEKRIRDFADILIPRIEKLENGLESFADPEFQLELKKAQITSACTDVKDDYEILSELLVHRINNKTNRNKKASISKAIEVVDKIENDYLNALTVAYSVLQFSPLNGNVYEGLKTLDELFAKLPLNELPTGQKWLSYLDILDILRFNSVTKNSDLIDLYYRKLNGYTAVGIKRDSEEYDKAIKLLESIGLNQRLLVNHELLNEYVRIPIVSIENYDNLQRVVNISGINYLFKLNENDKLVVKKIIELYCHDQNITSTVKKQFATLWDSFDNLKKIKEWWNSIPYGFSITPIGMVIAHANAQRFENVPAINF